MADPVVGRDAVEQHRTRPRAEAAGKDLAVVGEDLVGHAVGAHGVQRHKGSHMGRARGQQLHHHAGAHAEPRVVVDAGDDRYLGAAGQVEPAHGVHLPQLHGPERSQRL